MRYVCPHTLQSSLAIWSFFIIFTTTDFSWLQNTQGKTDGRRSFYFIFPQRFSKKKSHTHSSFFRIFAFFGLKVFFLIFPTKQTTPKNFIGFFSFPSLMLGGKRREGLAKRKKHGNLAKGGKAPQKRKTTRPKRGFRTREKRRKGESKKFLVFLFGGETKWKSKKRKR